MATNVSLNGNVYSVPSVGEDNWGQFLTDYFIAIPPAVLQKNGGNFTITADVNFGATYGLLAKYFASRSGAATDGLVRLANLDTIKWRNFANSADIGLSVNSSDILQFNGSPLLTGGITSLTGDVTASGPGAAAATIAANVVTNAKLAQVVSGVFKARSTAGTGNVEDLSPAQATALLANLVGDSGSGGVKGLAPAPAAGDAAALKFLKADGTWAVVPGGTLFNVVDGPASSVIECDVATNLAAGTFSLAEGSNTSASGDASHAGGTGTIAQGFNQVALGQFNVAQGTAGSYVASDYSLILGRGANSGARANSFAVKKDGTVDLYGATSGILSLKPAAVTASHSLTMPAAQGSSSSVLTNNGSGVLSWAAPIAPSFRLAPLLEAGTYTASLPTVLGQYRTYQKGASMASESSPTAPNVGPTTANGMPIGSFNFATAGSGSFNISKWEMFIGANKNFQIIAAAAPAFATGFTYGLAMFPNGANVARFGIDILYDSVSGILILSGEPLYASNINVNNLGSVIVTASAAGADVTQGYFDIVVY